MAVPADVRGSSSQWTHYLMSPAPLDPGPSNTQRQQEDAELIRRVARGDREAFSLIYDRYSRPLFSIALRVLNDSREAEDIVHDVFIALWNKAGDFASDRGTAFGWCVTLTRNRAIDRVRARKRRGELLAESAPSDLGYDENQAENADSGDMLWQKEKAAAVRHALEALPSEQRSALQLAYFGGLTQQEIAARLREPLGTVKARIRRGLLKLRELLPQAL